MKLVPFLASVVTGFAMLATVGSTSAATLCAGPRCSLTSTSSSSHASGSEPSTVAGTIVVGAVLMAMRLKKYKKQKAE